MRPRILVGVVDSGVIAGFAGVLAARGFSRSEDGEVRPGVAGADPTGHGTQICSLIREGAADVGLLVAQVFARTASSTAQIAAAIAWLVAEEVTVINMSVGVRRASSELRLACERAARAGVILVASSPARGAPVYPAAYPQCIAASGDARCSADEISDLSGENADFGAHPFALAGDAASGGASFAAARVTARIARLLAEGTPPALVLTALREQASHHGPERRRA